MKIQNTHSTRRVIPILAAVLLMLSACSSSETQTPQVTEPPIKSTPTPTDLPPILPRFEPGDCRFDVESFPVECGDLIVLEDRSNPSGPTVSLHVAVFPSYSADPEPDPVIYLMGGGGGDALGAADFYLGSVGYAMRTNRDFILYNQRGVKRNDPYLACPGEDHFWEVIYAQNLTKAEEDRREYEFLMDCRHHLTDLGVNLEFYDSVTHAADLADLISLLGYDQANIYGTSYGTRLGLTVMRHHPDLIRSAILDAVLPPQVDFPSDAITSFVVSVENLFSACASQEKCSVLYPELEGNFYAVIEGLKAEPVVVKIDGDEVVLDHILFLDAVYMLLHPASALPEIPRTIHDASLGEYALLFDSIRRIRSYSDFVATGVNYSSVCKDEYRFDSLENSQLILAQYPASWRDYFELSFEFKTCQEWISEPADEIENTPVVSDIPSLVLSGHFDSITSPAWCAETAGYLENSFYYEFPNMAHGTVRYDSCALRLAVDFLDDPWTEPDSSCLEKLGFPEFR
jgi:pimeloyl-ACP methyl ester carboxylesterase